MANIQEIEGIGPALGEKLEGAGIVTIEALLKKGASKSGRKKIASETEIPEVKILDFVNMADLMRIKGVGAEFAELLEAAGVDSQRGNKIRRVNQIDVNNHELKQYIEKSFKAN